MIENDESRPEADGPSPATAKRRVDEEWKRAAKEEARKIDEAGGKPSEDKRLPDASFEALVSGFATQVLMNLGAIENPFKGDASVDLGAAKYAIDLLGILEEKTRGNLAEAEEKYLGAVLYDLRMRFVEAAKTGEPQDLSARE